MDRRPSAATAPARAYADTASRLFELSSDLLATIDLEGNFTCLNPAWEHTLGWSIDELIARPALELIHPDDLDSTLGLADQPGDRPAEVTEFENRYRCRDGSYRRLQWNARRQGDQWYAVARDVTERQRLEDRALREPLTGLLNRSAFGDRLDRVLARLERRPGVVGVLFIDLDDFKVINDAKGHEVGDRFLRQVAKRLKATVRGADTVARLGGDEFVIVLEDAGSIDDVVDVGRRVVDVLARPVAVDGDELTGGASVGIAVTDTAVRQSEHLLREADVALYRAKAGGGGRYDLFDDEMRAQVEHRLQVQEDLSHALEREELVVYYQPIVSLPDMGVSRCEALLRWRHPDRGMVLPGEFVPLAEKTGAIIPIGEWVLEQACRQAQVWRRARSDLGVTVNVSTRQLARAEFVDVVGAVLARTGLPPGLLCLEITETAIMQRPERVAPRLEAVRELGVQVAMDDFGSGYSSLTYLKSLPLDVIKIDKSFVAGMPASADDRAIVAALLKLARETERLVIAEGVETETLHAELVRLGCGLAQGFLYDRPQPAEKIALGGYSSRVRPGVGDSLVIREFMRQIGIPARLGR